jgi:hypothetical protein
VVRERRFADITGDPATAEKVKSHAPTVKDLAARGMLPLCAIEAGPRVPACWSVLVDPSACIAASVTTSFEARTSLYVASRLADGTVVETQWRPSAQALLILGPSCAMDDRPAKLVRHMTERTVSATLAAHAKRLEKASQRSRAIPWTATEYLQFRRTSAGLLEMNAIVRVVGGVLFVLACTSAALILLDVFWHGWIVALMSLVAYVLSVRLFLLRIGQWLGSGVAKLLPLRVRERMAYAWTMSGLDDEDR